ncbi:ferrous iron transport protein A [Anaerosphaera aminiphila DSM 21120]|uniref:Ferrous iron transport protein A n=1 Tax=Anaerosphaera aminiphila DSM 21120 TaxID=1120995 RepID=A0A1M5UPG7_9FIRM|nr:FeoA family protein [Anaerosphaera aminiphila]SHH64871.1 ferrous iron transport protein A [Anaerosphaera aminiphila DSM 21120]
MLNLLMVPKDKEFQIVKIRDKKCKMDNCDRHLTNLGFVEGAKVSVVNENNGNLIVKVKDSRVAIGNDIAKAIVVK